jgi:hypothetical protein
MLSRIRNARRLVHDRSGIEPLEGRMLLAVGPFLHTHNENELAVVDSSDGSLQVLGTMRGFQATDSRMADIAFSPTGRLYGVTRDWLYEINPATAQLFAVGRHNITNANSLVFSADGTLQAMSRNSADLFRITLSADGTAISSVTTRATLSGFPAGEGAEGDIAFMEQDLVVATTDNRLIWYRFDVNPDRPRVVRDLNLTALGVDNFFGLAAIGSRVYATTDAGVVRVDVSNPNLPVITEVARDNATFGDLRGAAYYAEAGGPVPVGTISGVSWSDRNGDGLRQFNEPILVDWPVYLDEDLNGVFTPGEPLQLTDAAGRYYFFGQAAGFYTVDQIIDDPLAWEQTYPLSQHPNLVARYGFDSSSDNQLFHDFGLPDLTRSFVSVGAGAASFTNGNSFMELPVGLGDSPFTIAIDATYNSNFASDAYLLSQRANVRPESWDFELRANSTGRSITANYCNSSGICKGPTLGSIDDDRHQIALTWDGESLGNFFDDQLLTESITTTPDRDADLIRFGNPAFVDAPAALRGLIHEIRIYNRALSEAELQNAFSTLATPSAYTVFLDGANAAGTLDFGNRVPQIIELLPEIEVRWGGVNGIPIVDEGPAIDLGRRTVDEALPSALITVRNSGNTTLTLANIAASTGFQITGNPATQLLPLESTSFTIAVSDPTPGLKIGSVAIANNDFDENPFNISLVAEILSLDARPRDLLVNSTTGNIMQVDPVTGAMRIVASSLPAMTDIAHHPTENRLYGITSTQVVEIDLAANSARPLFAHGVRNAAALAFSPSGDLFLAGEDVHRVDLVNLTAPLYADGGAALAGDLAFVGSRMILSNVGGDLYEVLPVGSVRLGNTANITLNGLASINANTLFGVSDNRTYRVDLNTLALTPQFNLVVFTMAGATYRPLDDLHNQALPEDTTGDGIVAPIDALLIINELNAPTFVDPSAGQIIGTPTGMLKYPDVNNDGFVTPIDALLVINEMNEQAVPVVAAEGEMSISDALLALLTDDLLERTQRRGKPD